MFKRGTSIVKLVDRICTCCGILFSPWRKDQVSCSRVCSIEKRALSLELERHAVGYRIQKKYNLTFEEYGNMLISQTGRCALCYNIFEGKDEPAVDHNHKTGKIRGLLCNPCNFCKVSSHDLESALALVEYLKTTEGS